VVLQALALVGHGGEIVVGFHVVDGILVDGCAHKVNALT